MTPERAAEIRREIGLIRDAGARCSASSRQNEVPALYSFASLLSAYADLAEHALLRGIDYQYDAPALSDPPAHKGIYIGEKLRQLLLPFCESEAFRVHLLAMFLRGERSPRPDEPGAPRRT